MPNRQALLALLSRIDQELAEAEALTAEPGDDETLQRAVKALAELRDARDRAEAMLQAEK